MTKRKDQQANPGAPQPEEHVYRFHVGETIANRYYVEKTLGFGGFSEVYLCTDARLKRQLAVKVISKDRLNTEVLNEAQTAVNLKHLNIIQIIDVAQPDEDPFYILMDYVSGGTLQNRLDEAEYQRLPLAGGEILDIVTDIASALDFAHEKGVLHRDVKPSNILLTEDGRAILADFGLAKTKKLPGESAFSVGTDLSGSIPYMSPEQVNELSVVDHRSDIYALGVVTYQALTGQLPYRGQSTLLIANIARTPAVPARIANSEIPEKVEAVLQKVLSKDPQERYPSCYAFVKALKAAAQAYIDQAAQYADAMELTKNQQWREALDFLEQLESKAPGYKDVRLQIEQVKKQVQLQELHDEAQRLLGANDYQGCLDKLNAIAGLDSTYPVGAMREKAQTGLAREQRESLDKQYQRASTQFKEKAYRACLDTLAIIAEQDPNYEDVEQLNSKAKAAWEREQRLTTLYTSSQQHGQSDRWDQAVTDLEELQKEEPDYPNIQNLLITARYMARLSGMWKRAQQSFENESYADCADALDELKRIDHQYKPQDVITMRQQSVERLYRQAVQQLQELAFEQALQTVAAVDARDTTYGDPENVTEKAKRGITARELKTKLDDWYEQAVEALKESQFADALEKWLAIQSENPKYLDQLDVEGRARGSWCRQLDTEAREVYDQRQFVAAVQAWDKIRELDPKYPIPQALYERAQSRQKGLAGIWGTLQRVFTSTSKAQIRPKSEQDSAQEPVEEPKPESQQAPVQKPTTQVQPEPQQASIPKSATATVEPKLDQTMMQEPVSQAEPEPQPTPTPKLTKPTESKTHKDHRKLTLPTFVWPWGALIVIILAVFLLSAWGISTLLRGRSPSTLLPTHTPTSSPTSTPTLTPTSSSIPEEPTTPPAQTPTPMPSPTPKRPTVVPTLTLTATSTETLSDNTATALLNSGIYAAPNSDSTQLGYVTEGDSVPVLGRSAVGEWLYIRNAQNVEGFAYAPRFEWSGNFDALPVKPSLETVPTPTPTLGGVASPLEMDLWPLPGGRCADGGWYRTVSIAGRGGDGNYTYYWNGEKVGGPMRDGTGFEVRGGAAAVIGTGKVVSGDGQSIERDLYIEALDCGY